MDIAIDNARNILYTLSQSSVIQVYDLGTFARRVLSIKQYICKRICLFMCTYQFDGISHLAQARMRGPLPRAPPRKTFPKRSAKSWRTPSGTSRYVFLAGYRGVWLLWMAFAVPRGSHMCGVEYAACATTTESGHCGDCACAALRIQAHSSGGGDVDGYALVFQCQSTKLLRFRGWTDHHARERPPQGIVVSFYPNDR